MQTAASYAKAVLNDIAIDPMNLLFFLPLLEGIPLWWFLRELPFSPVQFKIIPIQRVPLFISIALLILSASLIYVFWNKEAPQNNNRSILIYNRGYLNWEKPEFNKYGLTAGGMFGMLPEYLSAMGYKVKIDSALTKNSLKGVAAVVVINLDRFITNEGKKQLRKFVKEGGSLLVMGDHTGLGGIMEPLNDVLSFVKIRFIFDSAHYLKKNWREAFEFTSHPCNEAAQKQHRLSFCVDYL